MRGVHWHSKGVIYSMSHSLLSRYDSRPLLPYSVTTVAYGHYCTNVAAVIMEALGCPGLVADVGVWWLMGKSPWRNNRWGSGSSEVIILAKVPGVINSELGLRTLDGGVPKAA